MNKLKEVFKISNSTERIILSEYKSFQKKVIRNYLKHLEPFKYDKGYNYEDIKKNITFNPFIGNKEDFISYVDDAARQLGEKEIYLTEDTLKKAFEENQNLIYFNESKRNGYLLDLPFSSDNEINSVVNSAWTTDGKLYSDRIKQHKANLVNTFDLEIDEAIKKKELPRKTIRRIGLIIAAAFYNSKRILHTEAAHVITESDKISYSGLNYEEYTFNATFDDRTSEMCAELDGQVFKYTEMMVGLNAPPLHPNCRSTIEPITLTELHLPYKYGKTGLGERIRIPRNMSYKEFKELYL